jgi:hypothetical protein
LPAFDFQQLMHMQWTENWGMDLEDQISIHISCQLSGMTGLQIE